MALRIYNAENGFVWIAKDYPDNILGKTLYLGISDDITNYEQVPEPIEAKTETTENNG